MTRHATLILVAGLPGTGKSRLCRQIEQRFPGCIEVSIDPLKESIWDRHGFQSAAEKAKLDKVVLSTYFELLDNTMRDHQIVLSDYPFSDKQRPTLQSLCEKHSCTPVTIRLIADLDVLYERQRKRDLAPSRHPGHLLSQYRPGQKLQNRDSASGLLTKEEFIDRCTTRGYDTFQLGELLEVDMTDIDHVNRESILQWLESHVA